MTVVVSGRTHPDTTYKETPGQDGVGAPVITRKKRRRMVFICDECVEVCKDFDSGGVNRAQPVTV